MQCFLHSLQQMIIRIELGQCNNSHVGEFVSPKNKLCIYFVAFVTRGRASSYCKMIYCVPCPVNTEPTIFFLQIWDAISIFQYSFRLIPLNNGTAGSYRRSSFI